jgi:hypothetical protein
MGDLIEKELKNGVNTGKKLKTIVINKLNSKIPKNFQKAYDYALIKLLEDEKIKIVGYDPSLDHRKTKQAFKSDPIIFDSSSRLTRPDIQKLLEEMYSNNESYQRVRELFKGKLGDLELFYSKRWSILEYGTFSVTTDEIIDIASYFGFYEAVEDMISDLSEGHKKAFLEYWYGDSEKANDDFVSDIDNSIEEIINEIQSQREDKEKERPVKNVDDFFYDDDEDSEDDTYEEDSYDMYDVEEMVKEMVRILILLNKYEKRKRCKVWIYPVYKFEFNDIWYNMDEISTHRLLTTMIFIEPTYHLEVDEYGFWNEERALNNGGFENPYKKIENHDSQFEQMVDIISTYPDEERIILISILAKSLSNEPGSIQVFAEFYKKMNSVSYPERLNNVLGIVSKYTKTEIYDKYDKLRKAYEINKKENEMLKAKQNL